NPINLGRGINYPFTYNNGTAQISNSYEKIYIDLTKDGFYEESEYVFLTNTPTGGSNGGTINVGCDWPRGEVRMRFSTAYATTPQSCATNYGAAFEFVLNITDAPLPVADFITQD